MKHFYRKVKRDFEYCFNVETSASLTIKELKTLRWLLAETFHPDYLGYKSFFTPAKNAIEVGPRLNFETAFSTNAVAICRSCGLNTILRMEKSRRWELPRGANRKRFLAEHHDRMTECEYPHPLESFETGVAPEPVVTVPLLEFGPEALAALNRD